jgi:hypothetical protein
VEVIVVVGVATECTPTIVVAAAAAVAVVLLIKILVFRLLLLLLLLLLGVVDVVGMVVEAALNVESCSRSVESLPVTPVVVIAGDSGFTWNAEDDGINGWT